MGDDPNGSVDEVFFGRERPGREPPIRERDQQPIPERGEQYWAACFADRRWPIVIGLVVAGLAAAVVFLAVAPPGRGPAARPGVVRVLTGNLVGFRLGRNAEGDLNVQYLQTAAGQKKISIAVAATGLPPGVVYEVTAGECRDGTARVLATASGLPDDVTGLLLLTLANLPGSERSVVWVWVANDFGHQYGGVRSPFSIPDSGIVVPETGTQVVPGKPVCPLPGS